MSETQVNRSEASTTPPRVSPTAGLRVAVIGVGARSNIAYHVATVRPGSTIVAAADIHEEGRERARAKFGDIAIYNDTTELIAAGGFDAAIVTSPDDSHAEIAVQLLRAGIPSYVEKPLAITLADADAVLAAAAETNTPLYIGHNMRHSAFVK